MISEEWLSQYNTETEILNAIGMCMHFILFHEKYKVSDLNDHELDRVRQHLEALKTKAQLMGIQLERH